MAITAKSIIDKAATQLLDVSGVRWTRAELLGWVNAGQRAIALVQPTAANKVVVHKLVAGAKQQLPADGWMLLDVYMSMGATGETPGRSVRVISRNLLEAFDPNWYNAKPTTAPTQYLYDLQDQRTFWVYPPNDGTGYLQLNYAQTPADLTAETDNITILDIYELALLYCVLSIACAKDAEYAPGVALSQMYAGMFSTLVGSKDASEKTNTPNQSLAPYNPSVSGSNT